jgi:ABC-type transport system involved in multi-copper enzyme maturation permease subunit
LLGTALAVAVAVLLVVRGLLLPLAVGLAWALAALLLWIVRRRIGSLVGPLFFYDVVRLARRGRGTALRFVYGLALLVALGVIYAQRFPGHDLLSLSGHGPWISLHDQARFAQTFTTTLLLLQNVAVLVLTPAYLAGAIAEEKEKRTLALLLTTQLSDREIVLGKMLGRLAHIGGVLLVGLPVLSLAQLWGGVDISMLLAGSAVTLLTLLSVGGVCLFCSAVADTVLGATVGAYAVTALLGFGCLCQGSGFAFSPISFVIALDDRMASAGEAGQSVGTGGAGLGALEMLGCYALIHGLLALCSLAAAVVQLRPADEPTLGSNPPSPLPAEENPPRRRPSPIELAEALGTYSPSPPVGDDGLFWKEVLHGTGPEAPKLWHELRFPTGLALVVIALLWGTLGSLLWLPILLEGQPWPRASRHEAENTVRVLTFFEQAGTVLLLTVTCVIAGFRAAGCVSRERDRRTLDGLLTLPLTRAAILRAKWLGCVLRVRYGVYYLAGVWLIGLFTGALHPLALPFLALTVAAHVAFVVSVGLWVSLSARSTLWANFTMALVLVLFFAGGWLAWLWSGTPSADDLDAAGSFFLIGLNPWHSWWALAVPLARPAGDFGGANETAAFVASAAGGASFAALAAGAWLLAERRFRGEGARGSATRG